MWRLCHRGYGLVGIVGDRSGRIGVISAHVHVKRGRNRRQLMQLLVVLV